MSLSMRRLLVAVLLALALWLAPEPTSAPTAPRINVKLDLDMSIVCRMPERAQRLAWGP